MRDALPLASFIGFTGTPLLKRDERRSIEAFGPYIHTYRYDEAVRDGVVLDLRYKLAHGGLVQGAGDFPRRHADVTCSPKALTAEMGVLRLEWRQEDGCEGAGFRRSRSSGC